MQLLISDANVLIDMEVGGLLETMFRLDYEFAVPDVLYVEELAEHHGHLPGLGLKVVSLAEADIVRAVAMGRQYRATSVNDRFSMVPAIRENCPLLTGDKPLREAAVQEGIDVRGTLWLMEALLDSRQITVSRARAAYRRMKMGNRRLPWAEVESQLRRFERMSHE